MRQLVFSPLFQPVVFSTLKVTFSSFIVVVALGYNGSCLLLLKEEKKKWSEINHDFFLMLVFPAENVTDDMAENILLY